MLDRLIARPKEQRMIARLTEKKKRSEMTGKGMTSNNWINHVKQEAKQHHVSYKDALKNGQKDF